MKKRILSMVLVLTVIATIFTGCGAGGSANEITVSEMLNSIIEENGEVEIYKRAYSLGTFGSIYDIANENGDPKAVSDNAKKFSKVIYDGKKGVRHGVKNSSTTLKEVMTNEDSLRQPEISDKGKSKGMVLYVDNGEVTAERLTINLAGSIYFGSFSREEIAGESCMVFRTYEFRSDDGALTDYYVTVIKDTDYTKDKIVVLDSTGLTDVTIENSFTRKLPIKYTTNNMNWTPSN